MAASPVNTLIFPTFPVFKEINANQSDFLIWIIKNQRFVLPQSIYGHMKFSVNDSTVHKWNKNDWTPNVILEPVKLCYEKFYFSFYDCFVDSKNAIFNSSLSTRFLRISYAFNPNWESRSTMDPCLRQRISHKIRIKIYLHDTTAVLRLTQPPKNVSIGSLNPL